VPAPAIPIPILLSCDAFFSVAIFDVPFYISKRALYPNRLKLKNSKTQ
jgi:hypothetical protein